MTKKNKKGFTLTELIVVIVIIGILAAVLIPSLTRYIDKAKDSSAEQEAAPIVTAHETWLIEKKNGLTQDFDAYLVSMELLSDKSRITALPSGNREGIYEDYEKGFVLTAKNGRIVTYKVSTGQVQVTEKE